MTVGSLRITPDSLKHVDVALRSGVTPRHAAEAIGISYSQFKAWRTAGNRAIAARREGNEPDPKDAVYEEVANTINAALWHARAGAVSVVTSAMHREDVEWSTRLRAACWYLERTCPNEFGTARDRFFDAADEEITPDQADTIQETRDLIDLAAERLRRTG
jgi:hypothetical protein